MKVNSSSKKRMESIDNYMLDFKSMIIKNKLEYLHTPELKREKPYFNYTDYDLANLIERINDWYKDDIEHQKCIKGIIEF